MRRPILLIACASALAIACALAIAARRAAPPPPYDLLLRNGRIVDGTGTPWFRADVAVTGGRIVAVGRLGDVPAARRIDVDGLVVAPGFIDMLGQSEAFVLVDGRAASKITQGITTEITGEGTSIAPVNDRTIRGSREVWDHFGIRKDFRTLAGYFERLETRSPTTINVGTFVGAGGVRDYVLGAEDAPLTPEALERMKRLVAEAMTDGALGLSTSLQYVPGRFASTEEIVELARVARSHGGLYITHQRSESGAIMESLAEVFRVAREADIPAEIWHLKTAYRANWGRMPDVLRRIEEARAEGLDITANQYPYTRASNSLHACLPLWVREGTRDAMIGRLQDPALRERIRREMADPAVTGWENQWYGSGGAEGVMVSSVLSPALKQYEGMTLAEVGAAMRKDPRDALMDLVVADRGNTHCIISIMREDDVRAALAHPLVSIGTDSGARAEDGPLAGSRSHPRGWGSMPRILGHYVRDEQLLTLEEAVRKMTSRPAARVGLHDRGVLRPGMAADITVFDPERIRDVATFEDPNHYSEGVVHVFVNGEAVLANGRITSARPGRPLRGPGWVPRP